MKNILTKIDDGVVEDAWSGLVWRQMPDFMTKPQALAVCAGGWRLPTQDEFNTLIDVGKGCFQKSIGNSAWIAYYTEGYPPSVFYGNISHFLRSVYLDDVYNGNTFLVKNLDDKEMI